MTLEAYSSLPFSAGSAVAAAAGRGGLRLLGLYMRDPLRNTAIAALIGLCAMAGTNALYRQSHHLPVPLFGSFEDEAEPAVKPVKPKPVMPARRPEQLAVDAQTTGSLSPQAGAPPVVGNDDVLAIQKKLTALNLFSGTEDGLFGPRTAKGIRAFEQSIGRAPRGLLTPQIVALIKNAAIPVPASSGPVAALPSAAPMPAANDPAPLTLPGPAPLTATARQTAASEESVPTSVASADGSDLDGSETVAMSEPSALPKRRVQTIAVHAQTGQPIPSALAPAGEAEDAATDPDVVADVQRGLNSLGFLHGEIDGVAGEATARAIRNFEVYYNYDVTGRVTRQLVDLLRQNGAVI